ncbi:MAG: sodium:solute symporter family protein [Lewinella sp.]|uniref:sodium:solute symporter family protein n=1 Tax=Lewinella sp. TaxID=2004506 RepID=UPI003D6AFB4F
MRLSTLDWGIIAAFFLFSLVIGVWTSRRAGKGFAEFFLSGRGMPWWLLGISMVATTFSADTPNLVSDIVRQNGVSGNWVWWAFLLTGMLTVFLYAKLWRRSGVLTDLEFYELRYSGKPASFLRGFRAVYLGVVFNVMIMATVCLAAIKIGSVLLGLTPVQTVLIASLVTVIYTGLGGLRGVIITDFFQFVLAMGGMIWAAMIILDRPDIQGLDSLLAHPNLQGKLNFLPDFNNWEVVWPLFILPLAVQWWSVWYPGAEPGGGGYIVQRMLSAKDEKHAIGATLLFNITHYALRPWPWLLIALASLIYYPLKVNPSPATPQVYVHADAADFLNNHLDDDALASLEDGLAYQIAQNSGQEKKADYERLATIVQDHPMSLEVRSLAYIYYEKNKTATDKAKWTDPLAEEGLVYIHLAKPDIALSKLGHDLGFSLMLQFMPSGLLGLLLAALIAAFMSTISTHLNWGASYLVNDVYRRFLKPEATEQQQVRLGRFATVVLMALAALLALALEDALAAFNIILQIGAGTGLLFILRWFWWRINAYSEIAAMFISFFVAIYFEFLHPVDLPDHARLVYSVGITTVGWVLVTFLTRPTSKDTLIRFYRLIRPHSAGWDAVIQYAKKAEELAAPIPTSSFMLELSCMFAGCFLVYGLLFSTGFLLYGAFGQATVSLLLSLVAGWVIYRNWSKIQQ